MPSTICCSTRWIELGDVADRPIICRNFVRAVFCNAVAVLSHDVPVQCRQIPDLSHPLPFEYLIIDQPTLPASMRPTPATAALLTTATLLWAGNAVVGRMVIGLVPPVTLNFLRWVLAFALLLPLAPWLLRADSGLWPHWLRFALLGLLGVGSYNALQYLALPVFPHGRDARATGGCAAVDDGRAGGALARPVAAAGPVATGAG